MFAKKKIVHMQTQNELLSFNMVGLVYIVMVTLNSVIQLLILFADKLFLQ